MTMYEQALCEQALCEQALCEQALCGQRLRGQGRRRGRIDFSGDHVGGVGVSTGGAVVGAMTSIGRLHLASIKAGYEVRSRTFVSEPDAAGVALRINARRPLAPSS